MRKSVVVVVALGFLGVVSGCTIARINGRGPLPLVLNQPSGKVVVVKHIKLNQSSYFDYTASYDISEVLANELQKTHGDAVINIAINLRSTAGNFFANLFTLGLARARNIQITADIVEITSGPMAGAVRDPYSGQ